MDAERCLAAITKAVEAGEDPRRAFASWMAGGADLDAAASHLLLAGLGGLIRRAPVSVGGQLALCAGAMVERGADPAAFPTAVFEKLGELLATLPRATAAEAGTTAKDSPEETDLPEGYHDLELAAVACLSRSRKLRQEQREVLWPKIRRYSERYGFLGKMLSMLDEEPLLVVDVPTGRAWRARMDGVGDNFQLHTLLIGALVATPSRWPVAFGRRTGIPGKPLDPAVLAAASAGPPVRLPVSSLWQLATWRALESGRRLEAGHAHWIWNEGVPADIEPFERTRLVLVAPGTYPRTWTAARVFPSVEGSFRVEGPLSKSEAAALVARILIARRGRRV